MMLQDQGISCHFMWCFVIHRDEPSESIMSSAMNSSLPQPHISEILWVQFQVTNTSLTNISTTSIMNFIVQWAYSTVKWNRDPVQILRTLLWVMQCHKVFFSGKSVVNRWVDIDTLKSTRLL